MDIADNELVEKSLLADVVTSHISAMLAYWDKDLMCRYANEAYLTWFGKTREEMIDKMTLPELLGPELFAKNKPHIIAALNGNPQTFEREIPLPSGLGTRYSLANYYPFIEDGEVKGFFVHVADVSPVKTLEEELRHSHEMVKEQNKRLMNFANIVTHNLKSYANNLSIVLDLFIHANADEEKQRMLGFLKDISKGFSETIGHLTEVVDIQNKKELKKDIVVVRDYVNRAIDTLRIEVANTGATLSNEISADMMLAVNPAYMDSILLNLLSNAIKYRHPDRTPVIKISACHTGEDIKLTIADNGRGINMVRHGDKIFGMYKTFHGNADAKGVGLFLVRSQVEAMGGTIEVQSQEHVGTTFTMHFKQ